MEDKRVVVSSTLSFVFSLATLAGMAVPVTPRSVDISSQMLLLSLLRLVRREDQDQDEGDTNSLELITPRRMSLPGRYHNLDILLSRGSLNIPSSPACQEV